MNLGDRIREGVKWVLLGTVGNRILEFGFGVILARLLVPADFGMVITLQLFTGVVGIIASGGMGQSLVRSKQADADDFNTVFTLQFLMGCVVYAIFFSMAPAVGRFFEDPQYVDLLRVSALVFLIRPMALMRTAWLTREMQFKKRTFAMVANSLATGVAGTLMAFAGMGVWALVFSGLVAAFVRNLVLVYLTPLELRLYLDRRRVRAHSGFGLKVTALELLGDFKKRLLVLLLSKFAGPSFLGLYNKGDSLARLPSDVLIPPVGQPVFRAMSKIQDDLDQTKYLYFKVVTVLAAFVYPFFILLWWVAEPFVSFVYGDKWVSAAAPMEILVLAGLLFTIEIPSSVLLTAQNRMAAQIYGKVLNMVGVALACVIGLDWGLTGVAWGVAATQLVSTLYLLFFVLRTIPASVGDLIRALKPGISMNFALLLGLWMVDGLLRATATDAALPYLLVMSASAVAGYLVLLLNQHFDGLHRETEILRAKLRAVSIHLFKKRPASL